ncbi:hypothetical protein B0H21DRAFT_506286 [Amylocystis lapponica]|nr:hypothetical protein B0H21DRAFT_506286 [Amylocystis lapponica]
MPVPDLNGTMGAAFVGFGVSSVCFGVLSLQCYIYFRRYPMDRTFYKFLVAALWLLETGDEALVAHALYHYVVTNWGNLIVFVSPPVWSLILQVTLGAFAGAIVKACFAMRVWRFSKHNIWMTGLILLLAASQMGFAVVYTIQAYKLTSLAEAPQLKIVASFSLGLGVATDMVTAAALCYFLRNLRTGYSKDDSLVNSLTLYAVNTGILTSMFSVATLITYDLMPQNFIYMGLYFVVSKLYANSFLATLNTRKSLRGRGTDGEHVTMPTFLMVDKFSRTKVDHETSGLEIGIQQEVSVARDPHGYALAW